MVPIPRDTADAARAARAQWADNDTGRIRCPEMRPRPKVGDRGRGHAHRTDERKRRVVR